MTFSDRIRWFNAYLRGRNLPAPEFEPPFFSAQGIDAVHRYFLGCDPENDPFLQAEAPLPGFCFVCQENVRFEVQRQDPPLIAKILGHGHPREAEESAAARAPPADSQQVPNLLHIGARGGLTTAG